MDTPTKPPDWFPLAPGTASKKNVLIVASKFGADDLDILIQVHAALQKKYQRRITTSELVRIVMRLVAKSEGLSA